MENIGFLKFENLRFQIGTLKEKDLISQNVNIETGRGKHRKYLPYVFTEQGVAMLSAVLRSETADFMLEFIESDIDNMVSQVVLRFKIIPAMERAIEVFKNNA